MQSVEAAMTTSVPEPRGRPEYRPLERCFAIGLAIILLGYMFVGKGFAYIHIPVGFPLYVGEIVLGLGILAKLIRPRLFEEILTSSPAMIYAAFALLGVLRTVPYLGTHGLDAVRDSATYYYGAFMVLVLELVRDRKQLEWLTGGYGRASYYFVFWVPCFFLVGVFAQDVVPRMPGTGTTLFFVKFGDMAVHLAGAVCFSLLVAGGGPSAGQRGTLWYCTALLSTVFVVSRGGFLALVCALLAAFALGERGRFWKPTVAVLAVLTVVLVADPRIRTTRNRELSFGSTVGLVKSIFVETDDPRGRESTKQWRLSWWYTIADETLTGPFFWNGRGLGVNLAEAQGVPLRPGNRPLRSPHNVHMTVLARMGVPGLALWVLLHYSLLTTFYRSWKRARMQGDKLVQGVLAWVMCYWVASMINASFDVYLEGPQGAICFWSVMGLGLSASRRGIPLESAPLEGPTHGEQARALA